MNRRPDLAITTALAGLLAIFGSGPVPGTPCPVPGSHPTIQTAVDDAACTSIELTAQTYVESVAIDRSLIVVGDAGGASILEGSLAAAGLAVVEIETLTVRSSCPEALFSAGGAQILADGLQVERSSAFACPASIFGDGFESGDLGAWSTSTLPTLTIPDTSQESLR